MCCNFYGARLRLGREELRLCVITHFWFLLIFRFLLNVRKAIVFLIEYSEGKSFYFTSLGRYSIWKIQEAMNTIEVYQHFNNNLDFKLSNASFLFGVSFLVSQYGSRTSLADQGRFVVLVRNSMRRKPKEILYES